MRKFDTIDIFFISLICTYFITLACLIITILIIWLRKASKKSNLMDSKPVVVKEETKKLEKVKKPEKTKKPTKVKKKIKLSEIPLIQKLFLKEVKKEKKEPEVKVLPPTKITIKEPPKKAPKEIVNNKEKSPKATSTKPQPKNNSSKQTSKTTKTTKKNCN